jgi:hypothetical protein
VAGFVDSIRLVAQQVTRRQVSLAAVKEETRSESSREEDPGFVAVECTSICKTCRAKGIPQENQSSRANVKEEDRRKLFFVRMLIGLKVGKKFSYSI